MAVKVLRKDIIPKYYVCEYNSSILILHENLTKYECINRVTPSKTAHNLEGKHINEWTVGFYMGDRKWLCQCSCGRYCAITGYNLECNKTISCGHERVMDLTNKKFGEWHVDYFINTEHGMTKWMCTCSCGKKRPVYAARLINGRSKSCGHATNAFQDLTGQQFGEWKVIRYIGNRYWECKCSCGNIKSIASSSLVRGMSYSCGHLTKEIRKDTMIARYGEVATNKESNREQWQIDVVRNKESFYNYIINNFNIPTTAINISNKIGINTYSVYKYIHLYELENLIEIHYNSSKYEDEIAEYIESLGLNIIRRDRDTIDGYELDIYIPEKKLAIEFNGNYWHSELHKDRKYHQNKSLKCNEYGIRLIHIFEYEWNDPDNKRKILSIIRQALIESKYKFYARETVIKDIGSSEAAEFLNKYHLQGAHNSPITIGCFSKNGELLGVITLGTPRFNNNYEYEIHRVCWKDNTTVVGGVSKLISYAINKYNIESLISYSDLSKFNAKSYKKANMTIINISEPNYIWYNQNKKSMLTRYQTQKHKLLEHGLGDKSMSETEIMHSLGYIKIYDCGNIVLTL